MQQSQRRVMGVGEGGESSLIETMVQLLKDAPDKYTLPNFMGQIIAANPKWQAEVKKCGTGPKGLGGLKNWLRKRKDQGRVGGRP